MRLFADSLTRWTAGTDLAYLLLHELGHALGIGHSDVSGAVMSGQPHTAYTTHTTLQDDDARACRALYSTGGHDVIEFHHAGFDHYFVTSLPREVAALDDGTIPGWTRTGVFRADEFATPGAMPAWRFEGEPFALRLPGVAGKCERGTRALFRLYNDGRGRAPNHRYATSLVVRADMVARGWRFEGVGALGVAGGVPAD